MTTLASPVPTVDPEYALRPKALAEFMGQDQIKAGLQVSLSSASIRNVPLDHTLFHGPAGTGKTTLAQIVATQMGSNLYTLFGPAVSKISDLSQKLVNLSEGDVLFIDEIHALPREIQEMLYSAMEDFEVKCAVKVAGETKEFGVPLQHFTLIGATTAKGMLTLPMQERFGLDFGLQLYDMASLALIIKRTASQLGMPIDNDAAESLARRSRGVPRIANRLTRRVLDYFTVMGLRRATRDVVDDALAMHNIDEHGFDELDRQYLHTLLTVYDGGPAGARAIAASMQQEECTLVDTIEPFMMLLGLLKRDRSGRVLTQRGIDMARSF